MNFTEIFQKYYTDKVIQKNELHSGHRYDITYSSILDSIRNNINTVLEIGIGLGGHYDGRIKIYPDYKQGSSLLAWSEYLPNASIYGWDIHKCNNIDNPRIKTCLLDATSEKQVSNFF